MIFRTATAWKTDLAVQTPQKKNQKLTFWKLKPMKNCVTDYWIDCQHFIISLKQLFHCYTVNVGDKMYQKVQWNKMQFHINPPEKMHTF